MIRVSSTGSFDKTFKSLKRIGTSKIYPDLHRYGQMGVSALAAATPQDTGETAQSWAYEIETTRNGGSITWYNTNKSNGANVAILIQYGHGTGTGGYVAGRDYVNPAIAPVFDQISKAIDREVKK